MGAGVRRGVAEEALMWEFRILAGFCISSPSCWLLRSLFSLFFVVFVAQVLQKFTSLPRVAIQ